ncbi:hypothetical protein N9U57_02070 [Candidatus Pelagibacter sp.]|nr:hypothetical protein [Candidatus Pelagibacter sp.]
MHVLLTRPLEDSIDLIRRFKEKDITVSHLPLIKINKLDYPKLKSSEYNIIIFTSSNAIRNLDTKDFNKNTLCFCVGDATEIPLIKQSRLSVMPIDSKSWKILNKMGNI